jgi:dihydrofolate synthase/folylpolyglutamate synthase
MNFDQALSYLLSLGHETLTIKLGLRNTKTLLTALGDPHKGFPAVQIAGTNGKGSTAVMLDSICRAARIRAGLFTSPHLISITERIKIGGEATSEDEFARLTTVVKTAADELVSRGDLATRPTFFEHVTAIALFAFHEANVELAILETGLGGRLDSTTAAQADVVAITQVAMDHEEYLGHTLGEIAAEKAAIIRPGVTAIIGPQSPPAMDVILRRCEEVHVTPSIVTSDCAASESAQTTGDGRFSVTLQTSQSIYEKVSLGLRGRHQIDNARVAVALAEAMRERGFPIGREQIIEGLESAKHAGRLELWQTERPILFDGAHNPAAAQTLRAYLDEFVRQPITIIFGAMKDKRLHEMAEILFPKADKLILTELDNPRAASIEELKAAVPSDLDQKTIYESSSVKEALRIAREISEANDLILITGSLYLVGAAQVALRAP